MQWMFGQRLSKCAAAFYIVADPAIVILFRYSGSNLLDCYPVDFLKARDAVPDFV